MAEPDQPTDIPAYLSTPRGMFTPAGTQFHTTEEDVQAFAGPVLGVASLGDLVRQAEVWLHSPRTLALWLMPLLLMVLPVWAAAVGGLAVYIGWSLLAPSMGNATGARLFEHLDNVGFQFILYVAVLGWLASWPDFAKIALGLLWFILLRWRVMNLILTPLLKPLWQALYPLPHTDQMLRATIVSTALAHNLSLPEIDRMKQKLAQRGPRLR